MDKKNEYTHGGDIYRHPIEYDFSINVNPLGMPLASIQAAHEGIVLAGRYPDDKAEQLCKKIAEVKHVPQDAIVVGNGAAELLYALCRVLHGRALAFAPTFTGYAEAMEANGGCVEYVRLESFFTGAKPEADIASILGKIDSDVRLIFLCNPNNPTGTLFSSDCMKQILEKAAQCGTYVCVDECFLPFLAEETTHSMLPFVEQYPNLLVLRAFTKIYCMAGLRLGYVVCSDETLRTTIRRSMQPWNTSVPAQLAGCAALSDVEYIEKTREQIVQERMYFIHTLTPLVEQLYDGYGNFLLFRSEKGLKERLLSYGVLIRSCEDFAGLDSHFYRIGIRSHSENQELIRRFTRMLEEEK